MTRTTLLASAVLTVLLGMPAAAATSPAPIAGTQATPHQATAAEAARFVGDWILAMQGPNGPGTFNLSVKVENEKVAGEISSEVLLKQAITDVTVDKESLVLSYTFDYQGNAVDAAVTLTPGTDGKVAAQISFAGGAYVMTGSATKKDAVK
jgi:hypothetical protein